MHSTVRPAGALALSMALLLAACASRGPDRSEPAPAMAAPAPPANSTQRADGPPQALLHSLAERALSAESRGHWAAAALAWEALTLVQPDDDAAATRLTAARQRVNQLATERLSAADAALRRGELDSAGQAYLEVLALDPTRRAAADALRQIERERNRRHVVGRFSRQSIGRRAGGDAEMAVGAESAEPSRTANSQREHATMLARQGDVESAIQLLRDSSSLRTDPAHKLMLADLYVQKAESLRQRQPEAARAAVDAALAVDRRHAAALALRQQLTRPHTKVPTTPATGR